MLTDAIRPKVRAHIRENATAKGIMLDVINGWVDHLHCLIALQHNQTIADVARLLKGEASHWINKNRLVPGKFEWQDEYFAISVSESMVDRVRQYIRNQEEHHRVRSFREEYAEFMEKYRFQLFKDRG